jgi:outer membrane protein OmpA-like peptidoglycan-associated protein
VLGFSTPIKYFSPDNDGVDDVLYVQLKVEDESPIASWNIEIREPQPPYLSFYQIGGEGAPPAELTWDGRSSSGELVQSASDYPFTFTVTDSLGNVSVLEGLIEVDVLVIREGDQLRVQVPSIVFSANAGNFDGLAPDIAENNERILRRIADVLNKFVSYQVKVEGHANPTARTAREATREEANELQPLSELRAKAVVGKLIEFGVAANRLSSVGMGGTRPVISLDDRDNWWKNRRVEFILIR